MLRRDVTRGVAGTILLKVGSGGLAFALFSLAARTMTPDAFGDFATLLSIAQIASVAGLVGQELLLVRFLNEYEVRGQTELTKGVLLSSLKKRNSMRFLRTLSSRRRKGVLHRLVKSRLRREGGL